MWFVPGRSYPTKHSGVMWIELFYSIFNNIYHKIDHFLNMNDPQWERDVTDIHSDWMMECDAPHGLKPSGFLGNPRRRRG